MLGKRKSPQRDLLSFWAVPAPPYAPPENESAEGTEEMEDKARSEEIEDSEGEDFDCIQIEKHRDRRASRKKCGDKNKFREEAEGQKWSSHLQVHF